MRYWVTVNQDSEGMYVVECPSVPGCVAKAKSKEIAMKEVKKAIKVHQAMQKEV